MSSMNVVILTGNLTRDPEVNFAGQEIDRAKFGIAVNRKWTDRQSGEKREETCFVDCTAWKGPAKIIGEYCKKGSKIGIVGELKLDKWTAQDGGERSKITVTVKQVELLDRPPQDAPGHHGHYQQGGSQGAPAQQQNHPSQHQDGAPPQGQYIDPDSIPF